MLISRVGPRLAAFLYAIGRMRRLRRVLPKFLEAWVNRAMPMADYSRRRKDLAAAGGDVELESNYTAKVPWRLGVIAHPENIHTNYVEACKELAVSYQVLDIFRSDWIDQVTKSNCDAFLTWSCETPVIWKRLYDDRLRFLVRDLGKMVYPPYDAIWLYGSKQRGTEWLRIHGFPCPATWVFYNEDEAVDFVKNASYPKVAKLDSGSASSGVWVVRNPAAARVIIRRAFGRGLKPKLSNGRDSQWGSILFQEYIPDAIEWRVVRIGKSYFGHDKVRAGDFHSGTGRTNWRRPPEEALRLVKRIVDTGRFDCMDVDILQSQEGRFYVNELQTFFGTKDTTQMYIEGKPGRFLYVEERDFWEFEGGRFGINACCNLRVESLLEMLAGQSTRAGAARI